MKRYFDIIASILLIIAVMPVLIITYFLLRFFAIDESPLYIQDRIGKNNNIFKFYKFRSMKTDANDMTHRDYIKKWIKENKPYTYDESGKPIYKMLDDPRITIIGKFLRSFHLDELPQLFNVLKGDMSLVGPRPAIPYELKHYTENDIKRLTVLPGVTGIWQAEGNKLVSFRDMVDMDIFYIENQSLWLDIKILIKTFLTVLGIRTHWRLVS